MKLIYTTLNTTNKQKNRTYNPKIFTLNKKAIFKRKSNFGNRNYNTLKKNTNVRLFKNNTFRTRRSYVKTMTMFVPFSSTRKCGSCFRRH